VGRTLHGRHRLDFDGRSVPLATLLILARHVGQGLAGTAELGRGEDGESASTSGRTIIRPTPSSPRSREIKASHMTGRAMPSTRAERTSSTVSTRPASTELMIGVRGGRMLILPRSRAARMPTAVGDMKEQWNGAL
jgi:hypothetical protein